MKPEITKGSCLDCGYKDVCNEARQGRRKCDTYYYQEGLPDHMNRCKLNPDSDDDKRKMLKHDQWEKADEARCTLIFMGIICGCISLSALMFTAHLWIPVVCAFFADVSEWAASYNINLGAAILIAIGSIVGLWIIRTIISSVMILLRQHIRERKETLAYIETHWGNTNADPDCSEGSAGDER